MPMKRMFVVLIATALLGIGVASQAAADDVVVIVNKSNPIAGLTMIELRKIILGQQTKWPDGKKIVVLMTTPGQPERDSTLKIVCGMTETDFTLHFMHASFNGGTADPPKPAGSGAQVRQSVAGTATAVGFIRASDADASVRVITIDGSSPGQPAYRLKVK
jgi:ABC-type phosphate transport system substrate-binding protein